MKKLFTLLWLALAAFTFKATAQTPTCNAGFTIQFNSNTTVKFNPATTDSPLVQHSWTFGDGSPVSHAVSPTHTFALGGYAVVHTIVKVSTNGTVLCTESFTMQIVIQECNLVVDFSSTVAAGNPLTFAFQNLSTPLSPTDSVTWIFGDNTTSHDINPVHTYANYGTYNVCLIVKKNMSATASPCIKYICKTVTTVVPCTFVVDFNWTISSNNPLTYEFHNLSTPLSPLDTTIWSFGDGTSSTAANPVHTYANAGSYTVCLTVKKVSTVSGAPSCVRYICKTFTATVPCNLVVDFSWNSPSNPLVVAFQNLSTPLASTDSITWTFGDGTSSHDVNPTHTYTSGGSYNVCLTVRKNNSGTTAPCIRYICKTVVVSNPCNLVVDFGWNVLSSNPLTIAFQNLSIPLGTTDSISWTFGDGSSSHDVNPTHTYTTGGSYNVCLIVKKNNSPNTPPCIRYICKTVVITNPCNLVVDFNWNVTATNPLMLEFHNLSTPLANTDSITWSFGDGSSSHDVNPTHTYANAGTFTVCLIVKKNDNPPGTAPCIRYICKTVVVQAPCTLVANFTWHADSAIAQKIWFTNTSTPASSTDSVRWTFGDGTSSNQYSPDHTYAQPGTYNVCLRMQKRNAAGVPINCVSEICKTVVVQATCNFQASYSWQLDSVNVKKVYFTNTTIVPSANATATWMFGDGTTATSWNAVHEYANPGRYYVCLRVQLSTNCVRYKCDSITVPVPLPPCNNQSNFTFVSASTNSQTYTFIPAFQNAALATYTWTFGDGTGSHDMIATHHYAQGGTYTACLTVWRSSTCASTTCKTVVVTSQINCDSIHVGFTYQFDPYMPNKVYFYANANFPILDQTWTITRVASPTPNPVILHSNNPVYVFADTGYYNVCLTAVTLGGCVKTYCSVVHIAVVPVQCQLTAYPIPASTEVHINVPLTAPDMINVYVYNTLNVLVLEKHQQGVVGNNIVTLAIGNLVPGFYTARVIYGNHYCNSAFQKL